VNGTPRFAYEQVGDGLAIADCQTNEITLLNASAAVAWLMLGECPRSVDALEATLATVWPDESETAALLPLLQSWQKLGWVICDASGTWHLCDVASASSLDSKPALTLPVQCSGHDVIWQRCVDVSGSPVVIEIRASSGVAQSDDIKRLTGFLNGLPSAAAAGRQTDMSLIVDDHCVRILHEGRCHEFPDMVTASSLFNLTAVKLCYPMHTAHSIVHAGAVCRSSGAIILPAISGSGKTTLTAFLTAREWRYAGDDIIGLGRRSPSAAPELLPFPTALGIKTGSSAILMPDYPELSGTPVVTYGNKHVRFIGVEPSRLAPDAGDWRKPRALVFPAYAAQTACEVLALTEWEALELLLNAGTGTGMGTDLASFALLMELIKSVPCYRMRYGALEDAARQLEALL
jgi:hypothetical protein